MLVIGRGLMAHPRLLLLDEPSLGLAPLLVKEIFQIIRRINQEQETTLIVVEQNANMAMDLADYVYVMETGNIILQGASSNLRKDEKVLKAYLGGLEED